MSTLEIMLIAAVVTLAALNITLQIRSLRDWEYIFLLKEEIKYSNELINLQQEKIRRLEE